MDAFAQSQLRHILSEIVGIDGADRLGHNVHVESPLLAPMGPGNVPRAVVAQALTLTLLAKSLTEVANGARYVEEKVAAGGKVVLDHGALRTVTGVETGALPSGQAAFSRILGPLGFEDVDTYPLTRLKMLGHAWRHSDLPKDIAQFFVSELDVTAFSPGFSEAAHRVVGQSNEPLSNHSKALLAQAAETGQLTMNQAPALVANLVACFARQHRPPAPADYNTLLAESAEMAWIATEGNVFNHAADRVDDVEAVAAGQKALGRPLKDTVEVSRSGTVRQTAYLAATVWRVFRTENGGIIQRPVPGSFFEFISRGIRPETGDMDLRFDAANAEGIFKMTVAKFPS